MNGGRTYAHPHQLVTRYDLNSNSTRNTKTLGINLNLHPSLKGTNMLWDIDKQQEVFRIPHANFYDARISRLSPQQLQAIQEEILRRIEGDEVAVAGWTYITSSFSGSGRWGQL